MVIPISPELWDKLEGKTVVVGGTSYFPNCIDLTGRYISIETYERSDNPDLLLAKPITPRPMNPRPNPFAPQQ